MRITAITKYKHAAILELLRKLGWSQIDLARRTGISASQIGRIVNLVCRPSESQATKIQEAFAANGLFLDVFGEWPDAFKGFGKAIISEETQDVLIESLLDHPEALQIAEQPKSIFDDPYIDSNLMEAIAELTENEQIALKELYFNGATLADTAKKLKRACSDDAWFVHLPMRKERARQLRAKALRRLRQSQRLKLILGEDRIGGV